MNDRSGGCLGEGLCTQRSYVIEISCYQSVLSSLFSVSARL